MTDTPLEGLIGELEKATALNERLLWETFGRVLHLFESPLGLRMTKLVDLEAWESATVLMVQNALPGWVWRLCDCHLSSEALLMPDWNDPVHGDRLRAELGEPVHGTWLDHGIDIELRPAGRVPQALCIALLTALEEIADLQSERPTD